MDGNKPKGTGLGLAICREVITHHSGEIWAEAPQEGGTRMVFYLPAVAAEADAQVLKYDGRPFEAKALAEELSAALK